MSWLMASDVATRLGAELIGNDVALTSVITDTRKPDASALFFALAGPNFDAHASLESAPADVAAALVVNCAVDHPAPQIIVKDVHAALGQLAASWRNDFPGQVVALTGSNGKTTVKEMLASIFAEAGTVHATAGNLNNDIGVPLTLLAMRVDHDVAVIEMGANHPGEIRHLTNLARPDIALLNNAAAAHLEGFGSLEGVAQAKAEIFEGLDDEGVAVINQDDDFSSMWVKAAGQNWLTFGSSKQADVRLKSVTPLDIRVDDKRLSPVLRLMGKHNALNAAAATAVAYAAGISLHHIAAGLEKMQPVAGRLCECEGVNGSRVIDDAYNANPGSIRAAIDTLAARSGETFLVLGDMGEMGDSTVAQHAELGAYAQEAGINNLMAVGSFMAKAVETFGEGATHFASQDDLVVAIEPLLTGDSVVLVKGSRAMKMENVVARLAATPSNDQKGSTYAA